jgi:hypothetical protein
MTLVGNQFRWVYNESFFILLMTDFFLDQSPVKGFISFSLLA